MKSLRLPDDKALQALLRGSHVRVAGESRKESVKIVQDKPKSALRSAIEESMAAQIAQSGLPPPERQYRFFPDRRFRGDFCWVSLKFCLECDGAVHRIKGSFDGSFERGYLLLAAGWTVLHVGSSQVRSGTAFEWLRVILANLGKKE